MARTISANRSSNSTAASSCRIMPRQPHGPRSTAWTGTLAPAVRCCCPRIMSWGWAKTEIVHGGHQQHGACRQFIPILRRRKRGRYAWPSRRSIGRGRPRIIFLFMHANSPDQILINSPARRCHHPSGHSAPSLEMTEAGAFAFGQWHDQRHPCGKSTTTAFCGRTTRSSFPKLLWSGSIGSYTKMNCPMIANGKVYVGNQDEFGRIGIDQLLVFGKQHSKPGVELGNRHAPAVHKSPGTMVD